jgi:hypothetical protein
MHAVKQDLAIGAIVPPREFAAALDERMLAASDDGHVRIGLPEVLGEDSRYATLNV